MPEVCLGTIFRLFTLDKFGYILCEGKEYFFTHADLVGCYLENLVMDQTVTFMPVEDKSGTKATNIRLVV